MSNRIKAKVNLKKSLYFAGSISFVVGAGGLAVAIPTYLKVQKELEKHLSALTDLSKYISELTTKLGVSADEEFSQELSGGFEIAVVNGKTAIYKSVNGQKSLIMNMNADGTVGSAAEMKGLAAQKMLSVITEAKSIIGDEARAMDDILGPYVEDAEETSISIESKITGLSEEVIKARNALATNDPDEKTKAEAELRAKGISSADIAQAQSAADEAFNKQQALANAADQAAELERQRKAAEEMIARKQAQLKEALADYIVANDSTKNKANLLLLSLEDLRIEYDKVKEIAMQKVNAAATEHAQTQITHKAESTGNLAMIRKILANPASFVNSFAKSFGYDDGKGNVTHGSANLRKFFYNEFIKQGMTDSDYEALIMFIGNKVLGIDVSELRDWKNFQNFATVPKTKVQFSELINTYSEERSHISKLLVLTIDVTDEHGVDHSGYVFGRSTDKNILSFSKIKTLIPGFTKTYPVSFTSTDVQNSFNTVSEIISFYTMNMNNPVGELAVKNMIAFTENNAKMPVLQPSLIKSIKNTIAKIDVMSTGLERDALSEILLNIGIEVLDKKRTVLFDSSKLFDSIEFILKNEKLLNPDFDTHDIEAIYRDTTIGRLLDLVNEAVSNLNDIDPILDSIIKYSNELKNANKYIEHINHNEALMYNYVKSKKDLSSLFGITDAKQIKVLDAVLKTDDDYNKLISALSTTNSISAKKQAMSTITSLTHLNLDQVLIDNEAEIRTEILLGGTTIVNKLILEDNIKATIPNANNPEIKEAITGATDAVKVLTDVGIPQTDSTDVLQLISKILAEMGAGNITKPQFDEITKYFKTLMIFMGEDHKDDVVTKLKTILDPATIVHDIDDITKFNKWVTLANEAKTPGDKLTVADIEAKAWESQTGVNAEGKVYASATPGSPMHALSISNFLSTLTEVDGKVYTVAKVDAGSGNSYFALLQLTPQPEGTQFKLIKKLSSDLDGKKVMIQKAVQNGKNYILMLANKRDSTTKNFTFFAYNLTTSIMTTSLIDVHTAYGTDVTSNRYALSSFVYDSSNQVIKLIDNNDAVMQIKETTPGSGTGPVIFDTMSTSSVIVADQLSPLGRVENKVQSFTYLTKTGDEIIAYIYFYGIDFVKNAPTGTSKDIFASHLYVSGRQLGKVIAAYKISDTEAVVFSLGGKIYKITLPQTGFVDLLGTNKQNMDTLSPKLIADMSKLKDSNDNAIRIDENHVVGLGFIVDPITNVGKITILQDNRVISYEDKTDEVKRILTKLTP